MIPGELFIAPGDIVLNAGRPTTTLEVGNTSGRVIEVGSHYHFFEVNDALHFDRAATLGFRLDIPAGATARFEPNATRTVSLVAFEGDRIVRGFNGKVDGRLGE